MNLNIMEYPMLLVPAELSNFRTRNMIGKIYHATESNFNERFEFVVSEIDRSVKRGKYSMRIDCSYICDRLLKHITDAGYVVSRIDECDLEIRW